MDAEQQRRGPYSQDTGNGCLCDTETTGPLAANVFVNEVSPVTVHRYQQLLIFASALA